MFKLEDKRIVIITSIWQLRDYIPMLDSAELLAFDTETTGIKQFDKAVGIGFCWNKDEALYIPFDVWQDGQLIHVS